MQLRPCAALPLAFVLGLSACRGREPAAAPPPPRASILREIPAAAQSEVRDTTGTPDAEQRTFSTPLPLDTAAAFYRAILPRLGWEIMGDRTDRPAGKIDLYTRKGTRTLWLHLEQKAEGTLYTMIGADTAATRGAPGRGSSR